MILDKWLSDYWAGAMEISWIVGIILIWLYNEAYHKWDKDWFSVIYLVLWPLAYAVYFVLEGCVFIYSSVAKIFKR